MKGNDQTFSQLADLAPTDILREGVNVHIIDVVFDVYREDSIKNAERSNSGRTTGIQFRNMAPGHRIQQWRSVSAARPTRPTSQGSWWPSGRHPWKLRANLNDKPLYIASQETCLHITKDQWAEVAGLQSNQEEADARVILHATHAAAEGYRAVVVTSDDGSVHCVLRR